MKSYSIFAAKISHELTSDIWEFMLEEGTRGGYYINSDSRGYIDPDIKEEYDFQEQYRCNNPEAFAAELEEYRQILEKRLLVENWNLDEQESAEIITRLFNHIVKLYREGINSSERTGEYLSRICNGYTMNWLNGDNPKYFREAMKELLAEIKS